MMASLVAVLTLILPASGAVTGMNLLSGAPATVVPGSKGTVVLFLSARCPCSNSHVAEIRKLSAQYRDFNFVGVHSNSDEPLAESRQYFKNLDLPFAVVQDDGNKIADRFKALKTPHVFVINPEGKTVYSGGVTNSADAKHSDRNFLQEALEDIVQGRKVRTPLGRALGCYIKRS